MLTFSQAEKLRMEILCGTWSWCRAAGEEVVAPMDMGDGPGVLSKGSKAGQHAASSAGKGYTGTKSPGQTMISKRIR